jgi:hypothetical protein
MDLFVVPTIGFELLYAGLLGPAADQVRVTGNDTETVGLAGFQEVRGLTGVDLTGARFVNHRFQVRYESEFFDGLPMSACLAAGPLRQKPVVN